MFANQDSSIITNMEILVRVGNSKVNFERDKNLSGLSFFKTKGKAEYFVEPESSEMRGNYA